MNFKDVFEVAKIAHWFFGTNNKTRRGAMIVGFCLLSLVAAAVCFFGGWIHELAEYWEFIAAGVLVFLAVEIIDFWLMLFVVMTFTQKTKDFYELFTVNRFSSGKVRSVSFTTIGRYYLKVSSIIAFTTAAICFCFFVTAIRLHNIC